MRGVKTPVEERIKKQQERIDALKAQLSDEEAKLKALQDEKASEDKDKLFAAIEGSDKSIDDVLAFLKD